MKFQIKVNFILYIKFGLSIELSLYKFKLVLIYYEFKQY